MHDKKKLKGQRSFCGFDFWRTWILGQKPTLFTLHVHPSNISHRRREKYQLFQDTCWQSLRESKWPFCLSPYCHRESLSGSKWFLSSYIHCEVLWRAPFFFHISLEDEVLQFRSREPWWVPRGPGLPAWGRYWCAGAGRPGAESPPHTPGAPPQCRCRQTPSLPP